MEGVYKTRIWKGIAIFTKKQKTNTCYGCVFIEQCGSGIEFAKDCQERTIKKTVKYDPTGFLGAGRF